MENSQEKTAEVRLEDYMKQVLGKAERLEPGIIVQNLESYFEKNKDSKNFILVSLENSYYQVFQNKRNASPREIAEYIFDFMTESYFFNKEGKYVEMSDVREIEDSSGVEGLDIWVQTSYFQMNTYDWGVEEI